MRPSLNAPVVAHVAVSDKERIAELEERVKHIETFLSTLPDMAKLQALVAKSK